jgi:Pyridine nucleotide-disulphide oxidoreductase
MDTAASSLLTTLIEVGGIDTVYRDVYLDRARTVLDPMLPPEDFHRLEQERAALAELPLTIARALNKADWSLVKQLSERAQTLKREIGDKGGLLEIARSVYDVRDVRLDPFSPGLEPFTRIPRRELPTLRTRTLELLETLMLISRENFIVFTPMLHEVAAGDLHPGDIVNPLRRILRHVNVVQAEVDAIDLRARTVSCVAGLRDVRREFEFDHLLLALGSEPNFFEMAGVRDWTLTMKSLSDAALLHNTMVALLEKRRRCNRTKSLVVSC